ncbi:bile acid:sodium symporter family protein [Amycolatopsis sacchari]|uniref:Solute carrier family 10 (Sodium/bile acid cotransporter), member 7 n=1 Tax=Amycolatopsis sacchari TaxID=115433 RepID=A0A1I3YY51_9PSEU|nr:bile acid:sodium symporter family protein [Amycolatopsis sacchari]SFK36116.1 solute carrier family 10 (sodium/bile acid cotransporter), member 7 [Amycolatopsis sacchari]
MRGAALLAKTRIDPFILGILAAVGVAALLPARGQGADVASAVSSVGVGALFFLYGARLSTAEAMAGLRHWRLHLTILVSTFVLFPLLGLAAKLLEPSVLSPELVAGVIFLCALPSTVNSSIAFTSIARGNVAAAICAASFSSLIGIVLTPLLVGLLLNTTGNGFSLHSVTDIVLQLLVPFVAGQLLRRWIGGWITAHKKVLGRADRGVILIVVYTAFSEGVVAGIWHRLSWVSLVVLLVVNLVLFFVVLGVLRFLTPRLGFAREDRIAIVFCGSKKSLASGLPMATVLFPAHSVGLIVLPLMLFHQAQLMICAVLARRWGARQPELAS